uniref:DUF1758 domain-containing protein n=1 Tax=Steinernema glaseri TaxID=37863 RepID=A0A1I8AB84_9BILA
VVHVSFSSWCIGFYGVPQEIIDPLPSECRHRRISTFHHAEVIDKQGLRSVHLSPASPKPTLPPTPGQQLKNLPNASSSLSQNPVPLSQPDPPEPGPYRSQIGLVQGRLSRYLIEVADFDSKKPVPSPASQLSLLALLDKVEKAVALLDELHNKWTLFIQSLDRTSRTKEEALYDDKVQEDNSFLTVLDESREAIDLLRSRHREFNAALLGAHTAAPTPMPTLTTSQAPARSIASLPVIRVKTFKGDRREWPEFESAFSLTVDQNTSLPDALKLTYLKGYLEGDAAHVIAGLELKDSNYSIARTLLQSRFGDKTVLKEQLYGDLADLPPCADKGPDLRRFVEKVTVLCRQLQDLGESPDHALTTQLIYSKLPHQVVSDLLEKKTGNWTTTALMVQLSAIVEKKEALARHRALGKQPANTSKTPAKDRPQSESSAFTSTTTRAPKDPWCVFCEEKATHWHSDCPTYKTLADRKARLTALEKCAVCFKKRHGTCRSKRSCFSCKQRGHNSALCSKKPDTTCAFADTETHTADSAEAITLTSRTQTEDVLQTVAVTLFNPKHPELKLECHAFLDSGSQRSYTLPQVVEQLTLPVHSESALTVRGLSDSSLSFQSQEVEIGIQLKDGTSTVFRANTCPTICGKGLLSASQNHNDHAPTVTLVKPSLLLGNNIFWQLCASDITSPLPNGFTLIRSKLGNIVTGRGSLGTTHSYSLQCETTSMVATEEYANLWKLDTLGITDDPYVKDDEVAEELFKNNIRWTGESYERNRETFLAYDTMIKDQLRNGTIEEVSGADEDLPLRHTLPHRDVYKDGKLRIVLDASSKTKKSLNTV